ncbi:MAG: rRNA pseudouridine synthase [Clostridia bacterium]|nr:rRNA pseudouridine synthase [Clostridia bacterium]
MNDNKERLQKIIATSGLMSRRHAEEAIEQGLVRVNGRRAKLGDSADKRRDLITVDGKRLPRASENIYIMLNKPRGFVTTTSDEMQRKCVMDLVTQIKTRVYPIGRLDKNSEGLLLLTNDGEFANALMHPRQHIPKTYRVTVFPNPTDVQLEQMRNGIELDGRMTQPAEVSIHLEEESRTVLEITIYEGRNRQIRRMCESLDLDVKRLRRIAYGGIKLGMLAQGKWRNLTEKEVAALKKVSGLKEK